MDVWTDTFGRGSRFQRVFLVAPALSVMVIGGMKAGLPGLVMAPFLTLPYLLMNYALSGAPAILAWFLSFRLMRLLGLSRAVSGVVAAPVMALAASPIAAYLLIVRMPHVADSTGVRITDGLWVIAPASMVVSFLVATIARPGGGRATRDTRWTNSVHDPSCDTNVRRIRLSDCPVRS